MNTLEGNKLIAEFMGGLTMDGNYFTLKHIPIITTINQMKYHTSWDWLMPVVGKCDGLSFYKRGKSDIKWGEIFNDQEVIRAFQANEIDVVYKAVVEFIKWYNENK
jgi:hypothetical protein